MNFAVIGLGCFGIKRAQAIKSSNYGKLSYIFDINSKPINLLERFLFILWYRFQGYQHFYVHYSIWSLYLAKLVTSQFGGMTYLWDCEYYKKPPSNLWQRLALRWCDVLVTGHEKIGEQYKKVMNMPKKKVKIVGYTIRKNICMMPKLTPGK